MVVAGCEELGGCEGEGLSGAGEKGCGDRGKGWGLLQWSGVSMGW